jgi:hypothetical protein
MPHAGSTTLRLDVRADGAPVSLILARPKRAEQGLRFGRASSFMPPCTAMIGQRADALAIYNPLFEPVRRLRGREGAVHWILDHRVGDDEQGVVAHS